MPSYAFAAQARREVILHLDAWRCRYFAGFQRPRRRAIEATMRLFRHALAISISHRTRTFRLLLRGHRWPRRQMGRPPPVDGPATAAPWPPAHFIATLGCIIAPRAAFASIDSTRRFTSPAFLLLSIAVPLPRFPAAGHHRCSPPTHAWKHSSSFLARSVIDDVPPRRIDGEARCFTREYKELPRFNSC